MKLTKTLIIRAKLHVERFGRALYQAGVAQNNVGLGSAGPRLVQFGLKALF